MTKTTYFIFVRPPGSYLWTHHVLGNTSAPWRSSRADIAEETAKHITENSDYCAAVVATELPDEPDSAKYAQMADGDTRYYPTDGTEGL